MREVHTNIMMNLIFRETKGVEKCQRTKTMETQNRIAMMPHRAAVDGNNVGFSQLLLQDSHSFFPAKHRSTLSRFFFFAEYFYIYSGFYNSLLFQDNSIAIFFNIANVIALMIMLILLHFLHFIQDVPLQQ